MDADGAFVWLGSDGWSSCSWPVGEHGMFLRRGGRDWGYGKWLGIRSVRLEVLLDCSRVGEEFVSVSDENEVRVTEGVEDIWVGERQLDN